MGKSSQFAIVSILCCCFVLGLLIIALASSGIGIGVFLYLNEPKQPTPDNPIIDNHNDTWPANLTEVESEILTLIPNDTITILSPFFESGPSRTGAFLFAATMTTLTKTTNSTNSTSPNNSTAVASTMDTMMRTVECAMYLAGGNVTEQHRIVALATYALLTSDEMVYALANLSMSNETTFTTVRPSTMWNESCDAMLFSLLGNNSADSPDWKPRSHEQLESLMMDLHRSAPAQPRVSGIHSDRKMGAQQADDENMCVIDELDVFFINGIKNPDPPNDAAMAVDSIVQTVLVYLPESSPLKSAKTTLIHNPSNWSGIGDFLEVAKQWMDENPQLKFPTLLLYQVARFFAVRGLSAMAATIHPIFGNPKFVSQILSRLEDVVKEKVNENIASVETEIRGKVRDSILHGRSVLIVPHSQGNFYANSVFGSLTYSEQEFVHIVGVATPAPYVGTPSSSFPYVSRTDDWVIKLVPNHLSPNVVPLEGTGDFLGHQFIDSYIQDPFAFGNLSNAIFDTFYRITTLPPKILATGVITVTLTWGSEPDVDLHIFEPDGTHVYYANKNGSYGFLDVDDVTGNGPENYFVECKDLDEGIWTVGVNYYSGYLPETAKISVTAGGATRNFARYLPYPRGPSGNSDPVPVAQIQVTKINLFGKYVPNFYITEL